MYPTINTNVHYNNIGERFIITNISNAHTSVISASQYEVLRRCDGKHSIEDILLMSKSMLGESYKEEKIMNFLSSLKKFNYVRFLPCPIEIVSPITAKYNSVATSLVKPNSFHSLTIQILDVCPLKCYYCSQGKSQHKDGIILSASKIKSILFQAKEMGALIFSIFGGEPLIHPDIIEIIKYAYSIGYKSVEISTKGTTVDERILKDLVNTPLKQIQFSVDTHIKEIYEKTVGVEGSYSKMLRGLCLLLDSHINVNLKIIITQENQHNVLDTILFFKELGVNNIFCEVVTPVGRANLNMLPDETVVMEIEKKLKSFNAEYGINSSIIYNTYGRPKQCGGGISSLFIFADGKVGPCDKAAIFSDIIDFPTVEDEESISEFWLGDKLSNYRTIRNRNKVCLSCKDVNMCLGGCILNSIIEFDKIDADPMCRKISHLHGMYPKRN